MDVRSLAYRTELGLIAFDGSVQDRGDYLVAHSPANPGFYWGNFLLYPCPPTADDIPRWVSCFAAEFGDRPDVRHVALGWDDDDGNRGAAAVLVEAGYELQDDQVLSMQRPPAPPADAPLIRPLSGDQDWEAMRALNMACDPLEGSGELRDQFKQRIRSRYRAMVEGNLGVFLGAWVDGALVAELGLFRLGTLGRFQCVETHPDFRNQGLCSALVNYACRFGFEELAVSELVIVANPGEQAERIYRRAGFASAGRQIGVHRGPEATNAEA